MQATTPDPATTAPHIQGQGLKLQLRQIGERKAPAEPAILPTPASDDSSSNTSSAACYLFEVCSPAHAFIYRTCCKYVGGACDTVNLCMGLQLPAGVGSFPQSHRGFGNRGRGRGCVLLPGLIHSSALRGCTLLQCGCTGGLPVHGCVCLFGTQYTQDLPLMGSWGGGYVHVVHGVLGSCCYGSGTWLVVLNVNTLANPGTVCSFVKCLLSRAGSVPVVRWLMVLQTLLPALAGSLSV